MYIYIVRGRERERGKKEERYVLFIPVDLLFDYILL
jgi:hypothetical protein